jgi:hypothetical protein
VSAFSEYGAKNKIPSLWLYGKNDSLFGPDLAARMHQAFQQAGGRGRLVEFAAFKRDAHGMLASRDGPKVWLADTEKFLNQVGMPTKVLHNVPELPTPAATKFAKLDDIDAVPFLSPNGRKAYREYLSKLTPRAFALSPSGAWCWAEEGEDPDARALATCSAKSSEPCKLYSIDERVVWNGDKVDSAEKAAVTASLAPVEGAAITSGSVGSTSAN